MAKKTLVIPDNKVFRRLQNEILSDEMKEWLYQTYQNSQTLGNVIMDAMESSWLAVNRRYLNGEIPLSYEWDQHQVTDIDVLEKTIPNNLVDYMRRFGYDEFFSLPEDFKMGLVITFEFAYRADFPMMSAKDKNITLSKFYVSEFYIFTLDGNMYFFRCMTRQMA